MDVILSKNSYNKSDHMVGRKSKPCLLHNSTDKGGTMVAKINLAIILVFASFVCHAQSFTISEIKFDIKELSRTTEKIKNPTGESMFSGDGNFQPVYETLKPKKGSIFLKIIFSESDIKQGGLKIYKEGIYVKAKNGHKYNLRTWFYSEAYRDHSIKWRWIDYWVYVGNGRIAKLIFEIPRTANISHYGLYIGDKEVVKKLVKVKG